MSSSGRSHKHHRHKHHRHKHRRHGRSRDEDRKEVSVEELMGFSGFGSTKNQKVEGNIGTVAKITKAKRYRQYMNRKGGFNRPLDSMR